MTGEDEFTDDEIASLFGVDPKAPLETQLDQMIRWADRNRLPTSVVRGLKDMKRPFHALLRTATRERRG